MPESLIGSAAAKRSRVAPSYAEQAATSSLQRDDARTKLSRINRDGARGGIYFAIPCTRLPLVSRHELFTCASWRPVPAQGAHALAPTPREEKKKKKKPVKPRRRYLPC